MKVRAKSTRTRSSKRFPRLSLIGITTAITVLAIGALTAVSMQRAQVKRMKAEERKTPVANATNDKFVSVQIAGQKVQVDGQTGQIKPLSPEEAKKLAAGVKDLVNQSSEGLTSVNHADGLVSIDLQGRFQNVAVAKKEADGTVSQSCIDNSRSAAEFFEIDPQLFESQKKAGPAAQSTPDAAKQTRRGTPGKGELQ